MRVAVLDDYQMVAEEMGDWSLLGADVAITFFCDHLHDEDALVARLAGFEVIVAMRERTPFPRTLIERLPALRLLVTTGGRNRAIDLRACAERGVTVCTTGDQSSPADELTWALILALAKRVPSEDLELREGRWQTTLGTEIRGKTLAIAGLGRQGTSVARVGQAFGMRTIAWSANLTDERASAAGVLRVAREDLFREADFLTIHLVLSERTRGLVGAAELALMKRSAYLVNTSRGPLVDAAALVDALRSGRIAGAGLDVYDEEPLPAGDPLRDAPNTILLPHVGHATREAYARYFPNAIEDIIKWREGTPVRIAVP